jgi:3-hydroxymyristoyl/3-hydroxydecanoyl-(acyl carrier protein) dehydratase
MIDLSKAFSGLRVKSNDSKLEADWLIPAELPYLNGHFPDRPIFPAVGIVDASVFVVQSQIKGARLESIISAKFLAPMQPGAQVKIEAQPSANGEWQIEWKNSASAERLATLRLRLH